MCQTSEDYGEKQNFINNDYKMRIFGINGSEFFRNGTPQTAMETCIVIKLE